MTNTSVDRLLKENETLLLRERRAVDRKPFARPVTIVTGRDRDEVHDAFSRDLSSIGIGVVSRVNWPEHARADLTVHTIASCEQIRVSAEARWTEAFGKDWFLTGWHFVDDK